MRNGHAVGPIVQTAAQNNQICAAHLEIVNQPTAAPNGGSRAQAADQPGRSA